MTVAKFVMAAALAVDVVANPNDACKALGHALAAEITPATANTYGGCSHEVLKRAQALVSGNPECAADIGVVQENLKYVCCKRDTTGCWTTVKEGRRCQLVSPPPAHCWDGPSVEVPASVHSHRNTPNGACSETNQTEVQEQLETQLTHDLPPLDGTVRYYSKCHRILLQKGLSLIKENNHCREAREAVNAKTAELDVDVCCRGDNREPKRNQTIPGKDIAIPDSCGYKTAGSPAMAI